MCNYNYLTWSWKWEEATQENSGIEGGKCCWWDGGEKRSGEKKSPKGKGRSVTIEVPFINHSLCAILHLLFLTFPAALGGKYYYASCYKWPKRSYQGLKPVNGCNRWNIVLILHPPLPIMIINSTLCTWLFSASQQSIWNIYIPDPLTLSLAMGLALAIEVLVNRHKQRLSCALHGLAWFLEFLPSSLKRTWLGHLLIQEYTKRHPKQTWTWPKPWSQLQLSWSLKQSDLPTCRPKSKKNKCLYL